jgi:peptidoglycan/LPS O-acetylase OafA/YrhL
VTAAERATQNRFVCLDVMRAVAPVLVLYSHVVALFLDPNEIDTSVVNLLDEQAKNPLRLEQHMGHLAVVLFFLVSGFIITHVGTQESHREFAVKRLFRVYPLLIVTVALTAVLGMFHMEVLQTGQKFEITLQSVLTNMTLVNYVMVPQIVLVGVAWTLVIEIIFYLIVLSLLAVLRRWTWLAILIELALVLSSLLLARELGPSFFLLSANLSFLPVVLLGQITWAVWSGRIPLWLGTLYGFASWLLYVLADMRNMGRLDDAYNSTFALGFGIFIVLLLAESRLRPNKYVSFFADRSYSLYLLHGPLAFPVMERLNGVLPLPVIIFLGMALTVGATELTFRFIEQPGQRIGRKLSKRFRLKELMARRAPKREPEYEDDYEDDYDDQYEDQYEDEYEPEFEPKTVRTAPAPRPAPIRSDRTVVSGNLLDSPPAQPQRRQPQYGERHNGAPQHNGAPRHREQPNGQPRHRESQNSQPQPLWPQNDEPRQNGQAQRRERHNGEPRYPGPQNGEPRHRERQNGQPRHREPQNGEPQYRWPQSDEPLRREPQNGQTRHRERHNGEPRYPGPQNGEPRHREPQDRQPRHREPAHREPPYRDSQHGESQERERRHREHQQHESPPRPRHRHRLPADQEPPPYEQVRRPPERAHRYRDE